MTASLKDNFLRFLRDSLINFRSLLSEVTLFFPVHFRFTSDPVSLKSFIALCTAQREHLIIIVILT